MSRELERLLDQGGSRRVGTSLPTGPLRDGIITRADVTGVWVTPIGGDARSPLGPCRGATRQVLVVSGGGGTVPPTYRLERIALVVRTEVVFAVTDRGVWIVAYDERGN